MSTVTETNKPLLIQIDDEVREMTPEEVAKHEAIISSYQPLPGAD